MNLRIGLFGAAAALSGCGLQATQDDECQQANDVLVAAYEDAAACSDDAECGKPLVGTACSPECDLVVRLDADTTEFDEAFSEATESQCALDLPISCDCPPTVGTRCADGLCDWDYGDFN